MFPRLGTEELEPLIQSMARISTRIKILKQHITARQQQCIAFVCITSRWSGHPPWGEAVVVVDVDELRDSSLGTQN